jgi:hypothetical protein
MKKLQALIEKLEASSKEYQQKAYAAKDTKDEAYYIGIAEGLEYALVGLEAANEHIRTDILKYIGGRDNGKDKQVHS